MYPQGTRYETLSRREIMYQDLEAHPWWRLALHIAGYSLQGKQNATTMAVQAVAKFFGLDSLKDFQPCDEDPSHTPVLLDLKGKNHGEIAAVFQYNYPIFTDDFRLRMEPEKFEKLRGSYQYRRDIYYIE